MVRNVDILRCNRTLAYNLRNYRFEAGITQEDVSIASKISHRCYQGLESGRSNPSLAILDRLATTFRVTVGRMLTLSTVRVDSATFTDELKSTFLNAKLACKLRTLDGMLLWSNQAADRLLSHENLTYPFDLTSTLPLPASAILRSQMECEKRGFSQPYVNFILDKRGESLFLRFYPVVAYPLRGTKPLYTIIYVTELGRDCEANYYEFCNKLLSVVEHTQS